MSTPNSTATLPPLHDIAPNVLALRPRALWASLRRQPFSVLAAYMYIFFEYVRPQSIYPALSIVPWARITLIAAIVSTLIEGAGKRQRSKMDGAIAIYTIVVVLSLISAFDPAYGLKRLDLYLSWVAVYWIISTSVNTQLRVMLMVISWLLWNLKMSQHAFRSWALDGFVFRTWGATGSPGWFENSGEFGIEMCIFFPISLYFALGVRKHVSKVVFVALLMLPLSAIVGAIASSSRGALLGCAAAGLWMLARSRYKVRGSVLLLATAAIAWTFTPAEQKERLSAAGDDDTSQSRLLYWERGIEFANQFPLLGVGYANWIPYYEHAWGGKLLPGQSVQLSHNIFIQAMSELGYTGLVALAVLIALSFYLNSRTRALARRLGASGAFSAQLATGFDAGLLGFLVSGFFITVLYYPYLWVALGMTVALNLSVLRAARATQGTTIPGVSRTQSNGHSVPEFKSRRGTR